MPSIAQKSLQICQLFEAELLLELMLRYWRHPYADDREFRGQLIENVTGVLEEAVRGTCFIEGMAPSSMNFVAAVYYAEVRALEDADDPPEQRRLRIEWLTALRHALPSCFCDPEMLG